MKGIFIMTTIADVVIGKLNLSFRCLQLNLFNYHNFSVMIILTECKIYTLFGQLIIHYIINVI